MGHFLFFHVFFLSFFLAFLSRFFRFTAVVLLGAVATAAVVGSHRRLVAGGLVTNVTFLGVRLVGVSVMSNSVAEII